MGAYEPVSPNGLQEVRDAVRRSLNTHGPTPPSKLREQELVLAMGRKEQARVREQEEILIRAKKELWEYERELARVQNLYQEKVRAGGQDGRALEMRQEKLVSILALQRRQVREHEQVLFHGHAQVAQAQDQLAAQDREPAREPERDTRQPNRALAAVRTGPPGQVSKTAPASGDVYHVTINGGVDQALLPPSLAAAAAREDSLDPEAALQQLSQALTKARVKAGKPLLRTMARTVGYSDSMLSRVFKGRLVPVRDKLEALAEQLDVDTRTFATIWLPLWEAANRKPTAIKPKTGPAPKQVAVPAGPPGAPPGFTCPACKAWAVDPAGHIEWHMSLGQHQFSTPAPASVTHLRSV